MSTETTAATPAELAGEITTWAVGGHRGALSAGVADHHPDRGRPRSRSCWFRSPSAWSSLSSPRRFSCCGLLQAVRISHRSDRGGAGAAVPTRPATSGC
jgi:hypothetical protein